MSITSSKNQILDYLWEWGQSNNKWGKKLVKRIVEKEDFLLEEERNEIFNLFLESIGVVKEKNTLDENLNKPDFKYNFNSLKLISLSEINGVNKLARDQNLVFGNNVTVIYGENGTGKSGYGRILKALGFSYDTDSKILSNVYKNESKEQSAKIQYKFDDEKKELIWNNSEQCDDLKSISVFNNNCVNISLDTERELIVTPIGFHLFSLLSRELNKLKDMLEEYNRTLCTEFEFLDDLNEGTKIYNFVNKIDKNTQEKDLHILEYTQKDEKKLEELKNNLKNLNKKLIAKELEDLNKQVEELNKVKERLQNVKEIDISQEWDNLIKYLNEEEELKKIEQKSLKEIVDQKDIKFYESQEFENFIKAADNYMKKLNNDNYPNSEDDICIYCRQKLKNKESIELIKSYKKLLNDNTQKKLKICQTKISDIIKKINKVNNEIILHQPSFGVDAAEQIIQPELLKNYNKVISELKEVASTRSYTKVKNKEYDLNLTDLIKQIENKYDIIEEKIDNKKKTYSNIEEKENEIQKNINLLEDKKIVNKKIEIIKNVINNLKIKHKLNENKNSFNTRSISVITSKARNNLITDNFKNKFNEELEYLRRSNLKINLNFKTIKGKSVINQNIQSKYQLSDILSEGEQKSIALSEFLAELEIDRNNGPVIFDDPVTSLDHNIIDGVARRLVDLSMERQVVIFTHSILLFNSIKQKSELQKFKKLDYKYYEAHKDIKFTGYLYESPTLRNNTYKNYKTKINRLLNLSKEERKKRENEIAIEGYNKLRAAIEVLIEKEVLNNIVKRYRKNVAVTMFDRINGSLIDKNKHELIRIFERCCSYTDAHSDTPILNTNPSLEELKIDFNKVDEIRSEFIN